MTDAQVANRAPFPGATPTSLSSGDGAKPGRAAASGAKKRSHESGAFSSGVRDAFETRRRLFKLELKRNGVSAAYIAAFAVGSAVLGVAAWLVLVAGVVGGLLSAGLHWALAVIVALALQGLAVFVLLRAIRAFVRNLTFEAVRRSWLPKHSKDLNGPIS